MMKSNLLVIDGDFMLYYATQGNKVLDLEGNPLRENNKFVYTDRTLEEVHNSVDDIMVNIFRTTGIYDYIGFLGGKKCFRYDIYPEYKANRKNLVRPNFWQECKDYLVHRWHYQICDYIEADDAVNITRNRLKDTHNCVIVTTDKDLIKCIAGDYLNPRDFSLVSTDKSTAEYNFWASMIIGDSIDNIKGLKGKGKAYVNKLFKGITEDYSFIVLKAFLENDPAYGYSDFRMTQSLLKILDEKEDFIVPNICTNKHVGDAEWQG